MSKRPNKWHLFEEVADLAELVRGVEEIPVALRCALADISPRGTTVARLLDLREQFYALPESAQRAALRGWRPAPVRMPRQRILEIESEKPVLRVMELTCQHYRSDRPAAARHTFEIGQWCGEAVCVQVREGASLKDVLFELSRLFHFAKNNWAALIDDPAALEVALKVAEELAEKEKRPHAQPLTSTPGSNESKRAEAMTAA